MQPSLKYKLLQLYRELKFETSRSGGKGGQNVNKVETKVDVLFDLEATELFTYYQKERLKRNLHNRISDGVLRLSCSETRSQLRNKELAIERLKSLLEDALAVQKKRIPTKVSKGKKAARAKDKKAHKAKKENRRKPRKEDY
jgi:ribosome-associated protein